MREAGRQHGADICGGGGGEEEEEGGGRRRGEE